MDMDQFNFKIPTNVKTSFQVKVLKNKKTYGNQAEVLTKLLTFFNKYGLPDKEQ